jgi:hypothetical protein
MFEMNLKAINVEIRGKEKKVSQSQGKEYLIVRVEDEAGRSSELYDPNVENEGLYKKGMTGDFLLNVKIGKYSKVTVKDFQPTMI